MELKQIVSEISEAIVYTWPEEKEQFGEAAGTVIISKSSFDKARGIGFQWKGQMRQILKDRTSFEPIPITLYHLPYVVEYKRDFRIFERVKPEYKTVFKSYKLPPCDFMVQYKRPCMFLNTPSDKLIGKRSKQELLLKHLLNYDHFGEKKPMCHYHKANIPCIHFENVLNNKNLKDDNFDEYFQDYRHLYMYFHKPNNREKGYNHSSSQLFEFLSKNEMRKKRRKRKREKKRDELDANEDYNLLVLINEVIKNGFEEDLLPRNDVDSRVDASELIKNTVNSYRDTLALDSDLGPVLKQLAQHYKIFDKLNEKMNHERHKKMGCPLSVYQMLSIILYCNGKCNHNLCESQRDDTWEKKWEYFDVGLDTAIHELSRHEIHEENIYTGLAGIFLDVNQLYCRGLGSLTFYFKTYVSFTRDLRVATEFRGGEGLIIGVNLYQSWMWMDKNNVRACDVSWISKFPHEQEILVSTESPFQPCLSKFKQIGNKQWIVCNHGNDKKGSFENMFDVLM